MALVFLLIAVTTVSASKLNKEMAVVNITRYASGDFFTVVGADCGSMMCMEFSGGTARASNGLGGDCICQCQPETPAFREDRHNCDYQIDECRMAIFGRGSTNPQIPLVFLPLKGQIIYPSKEIVFTEVTDSICAVTSSQYLTSAGWVTLRDVVDNDVPFGLYRDEGNIFLQWRGSAALHSRLEGRLVTVHVLCSSASTQLATSCAAFRIAGTSHNSLLDVRSIPFHAGEPVTQETAAPNQSLSVLESLAIGVCVLLLIFIYTAGIMFYMHYKKKHKKKQTDAELNFSDTLSTENDSPNYTLNSLLEIEGKLLKNNPLVKLEMNANYLNDPSLSDVSEHTEDNVDSSPNSFRKSSFNITAAVIHTRRKKPSRPTTRAVSTPERLIERLQRRSQSPDTLEKAPHSELSIIECSGENNVIDNKTPTSTGQLALRKKLYFNPVFFETVHLKDPPPAAIEFLVKIREVMSIAKEKMISKRFIPILTDIAEEELYSTIDLGWDIPCARRGRRLSAINLVRENSRRAIHCGGCPGCGSSIKDGKLTALVRSNSCTTCESEDYKQRIVRKWLDEVPNPISTVKTLGKSIAKVNGTPRMVESKAKDEEIIINPIEPVRSEETQTLQVTDSILKEKDDTEKQKITNTEYKRKIKSKITASDAVNNKVRLEFTAIPTSPKNNSHNTRNIKKKVTSLQISDDLDKLTITTDNESIPREIKLKMEAVIRELNECTRTELELKNEMKSYSNELNPKLIIPVIAADSINNNYIPFNNNKEDCLQNDVYIEVDSLESNTLKNRRHSLEYDSETSPMSQTKYQPFIMFGEKRLSRSWRDVRRVTKCESPECDNKSKVVGGIFIKCEDSYSNSSKPGSLTIAVPDSPVVQGDNVSEDFDQDTLDRKPKRDAKKRIDKILLKSGGSFKHKSDNIEHEKSNYSPPQTVFSRKIGSLRQIYEAKTKSGDLRYSFYERRGSLPYGETGFETFNSYKKRSKEPNATLSMITKKWCSDEISLNIIRPNRDDFLGNNLGLFEERDKFPSHLSNTDLDTGRISARPIRCKSNRNEFKKPYKTEDSGYLSTDSNDSKCRGRYLMKFKPKTEIVSNVVIANRTLRLESDTDDLESLCDGRSESGGESIETDSVFFGKVSDTKRTLTDLNLETNTNVSVNQDSGFVGDTNLLFSGDSDSEHKSVISIVTDRNGRTSASSISRTENPILNDPDEC